MGSRYFQTPPLLSSKRTERQTTALRLQHPETCLRRNSNDEYWELAQKLTRRCCSHYENTTGHVQYRTLYVGGLGPCAYLRLRLALHHIELSCRVSGDERESLNGREEMHRETADKLLREGLHATEAAKRLARSRNHDSVCTLLEGKIIGAQALECATLHAMGRSEESRRIGDLMLCLGQKIVRTMEPSKCEVLYGRAGFLQAILFIRRYTSDASFGGDVAADIIQQVILEGLSYAETGTRSVSGTCNLPLLWEWCGEEFLGAAHGVVGVLLTLLNFASEIRVLEVRLGKDFMRVVKTTVDGLDGHCSPSGNLACVLGDTGDKDELVHWCHGAPGHVLLLCKAYEVFREQKYLDSAREICEQVIYPRGLLRKGLGLCHGIGGNAYSFLSVYRALLHTDQSTADGWLELARQFADFGISKLNELAIVPHNAASLYEGLAGFATLLIDLQNPRDARFPCFEN